jgi:hypothetical protein
MKTFCCALLVALASGCAIHTDRGHHSGSQVYGAGDVSGNADKVLVCHKGKKTLTLPESAVDAHLGHGDHRGPC